MFSICFVSLLLATALALNPLAGHKFYLNPAYSSKIRSSKRGASKAEKRLLNRARKIPTAVWLVERYFVKPNVGVAAKTLKKAAQKGRLVTFIVYNVPNRDCGAGAASGELCCSRRGDGSCDVFDSSNLCEDGLRQYKENFINPLAVSVKEYCSRVPMALVIEPDAVPNLATNQAADCKNRATQAAYRNGVKYAVETLSKACPSAAIYVDAAHGGWLGWTGNSELYAAQIAAMGIAPMLRGFSLNLSNYQEMGIICPEVGFCNGGSNANHKCCKVNSCNLTSQNNPGFTILNYAASLRQVMQRKIPSFEPHFIIDTSRNGVGDARKASCGNWCNIRDAGVGNRPSTNTADKSLIDAYMWIKPPGESDGCTRILPDGTSCPRFTSGCASADSLGSRQGEPRAPDGGSWFDFQIKLLLKNGNL